MTNQKLCVDCKYYTKTTVNTIIIDGCKHPQLVNRINGLPSACYDERNMSDRGGSFASNKKQGCGYDGNLYEAK